MGRQKLFLVAVLTLTLTGCLTGAPLRVEHVSTVDLSAEPKVVTLITRTAHDVDLRRALARYGIQVKRFPSTRIIEHDISPAETETFADASTRFGVSFYPGSVIDWCPARGEEQFGRAVLELTDLKTNEIVLVVESGGWTGIGCLGVGQEDLLWPKLAKALAETWNDGPQATK